MKPHSLGALHIVVAERQDQAVGVFWTRHPRQQLANISTATALARTQICAAAGAERIVRALRIRFEGTMLFGGPTRESEYFWTVADFEDVIAALGEFDLERGVFIERSSVKLHDAVYVSNLGRGVVTGFTRCGRVMVRLDRPGALTEVGAIAPRSSLKPVVRAAP